MLGGLILRRILAFAAVILVASIALTAYTRCRHLGDDLQMTRQWIGTSLADFGYIDFLFERATNAPSGDALVALSEALRARHHSIRAAIALHGSQLSEVVAHQFAKLPNEQSTVYIFDLSQKDVLTSEDKANIVVIHSYWRKAHDAMMLEVSAVTGEIRNPSSFATCYIALMEELSRLTPALFPDWGSGQ